MQAEQGTIRGGFAAALPGSLLTQIPPKAHSPPAGTLSMNMHVLHVPPH